MRVAGSRVRLCGEICWTVAAGVHNGCGRVGKWAAVSAAQRTRYMEQ